MGMWIYYNFKINKKCCLDDLFYKSDSIKLYFIFMVYYMHKYQRNIRIQILYIDTNTKINMGYKIEQNGVI